MTTHVVNIEPNWDNMVVHYATGMEQEIHAAILSYQSRRYLKAFRSFYDAFHCTYMALLSCRNEMHIKTLQDCMNRAVEEYHAFIRTKRGG